LSAHKGNHGDQKVGAGETAPRRFGDNRASRFSYPLRQRTAMKNTSSPNGCHGCAHFYITYDPRFPYGCRALQFKSRQLPHIEVHAASNSPCMAREAIPRKS
jgi:hypothetical protein